MPPAAVYGLLSQAEYTRRPTGSPKAHSAAAVGLVNRKRRGNKLRSRRKQP